MNIKQRDGSQHLTSVIRVQKLISKPPSTSQFYKILKEADQTDAQKGRKFRFRARGVTHLCSFFPNLFEIIMLTCAPTVLWLKFLLVGSKKATYHCMDQFYRFRPNQWHWLTCMAKWCVHQNNCNSKNWMETFWIIEYYPLNLWTVFKNLFKNRISYFYFTQRATEQFYHKPLGTDIFKGVPLPDCTKNSNNY